jgi:fructan beta-fructosidase
MPIREIETLYKSETTFEEKSIKPGDNLLSGFNGDLFDIEVDIELAGADRVGLRIGGVEIAYDTKEKKLTSNKGRADAASEKTGKEQGPEGVSARLEPGNGRLQLRILVDKNLIEVYANNGEVFMPIETVAEGGQVKQLALFTEGGTARIRSLIVRELESVWE